MPGVICDTGISLLNELVATGLSGSGVISVSLFSNNHTPTLTDTVGDYTPSAYPFSGGGFLTGGYDVGVIADIDTWQFDPITFTATSTTTPETQYGYMVINQHDGLLVWAELFPVPIVIDTIGQTIVVVPTLSYQDRSVP